MSEYRSNDQGSNGEATASTLCGRFFGAKLCRRRLALCERVSAMTRAPDCGVGFHRLRRGLAGIVCPLRPWISRTVYDCAIVEHLVSGEI